MTPSSRHFQREVGGSGAASRSVRSGLITVVGRGLQLVLQLGLAVYLARILSPEDFGVQAMVFPVALLVQGIANSGLQSAIIQHQDLDDVQASALFWASLRWNAVLCTGMAVAGLALVAFYRESRVLPVTVAWAVITFGATLSAIHEALLKRQFRFGVVLGAHLTGLVLSIVVAVIAARLGAKYWTIVLQMAVVEFVRVALIWGLCRWRPLPPARVGAAGDEAAAELKAYWKGLAGARFIGWIGEQADRLTVGAMGGAPLLGFYDAAKRWGTFAFLELYGPLSEVAIASLSSVRHDAALLRQYTRNAFLPVLIVSLPIVGFMFAEAPGVILLILGPQWAPATQMLQAIAVAIALGSVGRLVFWVSLSTGQTTRQFRWMLYATPVYLAGVLVGARWGGLGVAVGVAVANALTSVPAVFYLLATTSLRPWGILQTWLVPLLASSGGVLALRALDSRLPSANDTSGLIAGLAARGLVFLLTYAVLWLVLPGGRSMLRELLRRPRAAFAQP